MSYGVSHAIRWNRWPHRARSATSRWAGPISSCDRSWRTASRSPALLNRIICRSAPVRLAWAKDYRQFGLAGLCRKACARKKKRRMSPTLQQFIEGLPTPELCPPTVAAVHRQAALVCAAAARKRPPVRGRRADQFAVRHLPTAPRRPRRTCHRGSPQSPLCPPTPPTIRN